MLSGDRLEELAMKLLAPLIFGGKVQLVQPIGAKLALEVDPSFRVPDPEVRSRLSLARVRIARLVTPLDMIPEPTHDDWSLVAALNDLLQATNHHLSGPFTRGRHDRLVASVDEVAGRISPPRSMLAAIGRHTLFARLHELVRTDTLVKWWTGSASFRGEEPSGRLMKWKNVRRVRTDAHAVPLASLAEGAHVTPDRWMASLALFLSRSPLTDLATAFRSAPLFAWSAPTLAFVYHPMGAKLAARAIAAARNPASSKALELAVNRLPPGKARSIALAFSELVVARSRLAKADKSMKAEPEHKAPQDPLEIDHLAHMGEAPEVETETAEVDATELGEAPTTERDPAT